MTVTTNKPNRDARRERFLRDQQAAERRDQRGSYSTSVRAARKWCDMQSEKVNGHAPPSR